MTAHPPVILTYHSLDESGSVISIAPQVFRAQMEFLVRRGIPVTPLDRVSATPGAVALTFDDGCANFFQHAYPVLFEYGLPATVFVVSEYAGKRNDWPSQSGNVPVLDLMSWGQLREIARSGIRLGAHTATHPSLAKLPEEQVAREFAGCRAEIAERTGESVDTLAYPYGDSSASVRACARRSFQLACGVTLRPVTPASDPYDLPRIDCYYLRNPFWFESLWTVRGRGYVFFRRWLRAVRQSLIG